jgi:hypothetical protein
MATVYTDLMCVARSAITRHGRARPVNPTHVLETKDVDARHKAGHDANCLAAPGNAIS